MFTSARQDTPLNLTISYWPGGGLCNQLKTIINTLAIAYAAKANVKLQVTTNRDSYNVKFDQMVWTPAPLSTLLDVRSMRSFWAHHAVDIYDHENVTEIHTEDLDVIDSEIRLQVVNMKIHERSPMHLLSAVNHVHAAALSRFAELAAANGTLESNVGVLVNLGYANEHLQTSSMPQVFSMAAKSISFSPQLQHIIVAAQAKLQNAYQGYNGLHLRIENDWIHHNGVDHQGTCSDTLHCLEHQFIPAIKRVAMSKQTLLYVASGIFESMPDKTKAITSSLRPFCSQLIRQTNLIDGVLLATLTSEQKAAIDFMLLRNATNFLGVFDSTFSKLVAKYRVLDGYQSSSNFFTLPFDEADFSLN